MNQSDGFVSDSAFSFGPFRFFPAKRLIEKSGVPIPVGSRALDILAVLVARAGEIVSKRDLIARVWQDVTVDEGALRFQIAALRRALGEAEAESKYVVTVPGQGYRFAVPVAQYMSVNTKHVEGANPDAPGALPPRLSRMVGREEDIKTVSLQLARHRCVTIVGPGGIGKTTVAVSLSHRLLEAFDGLVRFVDLATLRDSGLVAQAVASALGIQVINDPISVIVEFLKAKRLLLVFDSCEHVTEAVAQLVERIFAEDLEAHILSTSREPLRTEGEWVYRLVPLVCPPDSFEATASEALKYPAVQLFVERATAALSEFAFHDADAIVVAEICRKLDGLPLAIELAATRVAVYGLHEISRLLDGQMMMVWLGRRTAPPRHQTLSATLEWSYSLLSEAERSALRRLSVFVGYFSLDAALAIGIAGDDRAPSVENFASLVSKSLVNAEVHRSQPRYRLLDSTRTFALGKLQESGEWTRVFSGHANLYQGILERRNTSSPAARRAEEADGCASLLGNVRVALSWSFSDSGDAKRGARLVAASSSLFLSMSLIQECAHWTEMAIAKLDDSTRCSRLEMTLQEVLGLCRMANGSTGTALREALERSLEIAEKLGESVRQLRTLYAYCISEINAGSGHSALDLALRGKALTNETTDASQLAVADAALALTYFYIGDQLSAQTCCEDALARAGTLLAANIGDFGTDILSDMRAARASILWLRGFPDQAVSAATQAIATSEAAGNFSTLVSSIIWTTRVFQWSGQWKLRQRYIDCLEAATSQRPESVIGQLVSTYRGEILINQGKLIAGIDLLRDASARALGVPFLLDTYLSLARGFLLAEKLADALTAIDRAIELEERHGSSFRTSETFRLKGEILTSTGETEAQGLLLHAADIARQQSALSLELRATTSLAKLWGSLGRNADARDVLANSYARFTEGFGTPDLMTARGLLDALS